MNLFKRRKTHNREKPINWMTVRCKNCSTDGHAYVTLVPKEEIKMRVKGYKGGMQFFARCAKCDKDIVIQDERIPKNIWNYLWEKAYFTNSF